MRKLNILIYRLANHFISRPDYILHQFMRKVLGDKVYYRMICKVELLPIVDDYKRGGKCEVDEKTVVLQFDGKIYKTGLADRLRAITSIYHYCKQEGFVFKLNFQDPFKLENFLVPNKYDWKINNEDVKYKKGIASPLAVLSYTKVFGEEKNLLLQLNQLDKIKNIQKKQIHLYSNCFCYDESFYEDFNQLFKMTSRLMTLVMQHVEKIHEPYISASFRFTQLLGDLQDTYGEPLKKNRQQELISKCKKGLELVRKRHPEIKIVLVTSDSETFLKEVSMLPFVYIVPGTVGHIAQTEDEGVAERTFLDMFLISKARKAYMLRTKEMFRSGFAKRGAMIGNIEFEEIVLE